jgi:glycosyltransferase involved in cell wall biosynthesis
MEISVLQICNKVPFPPKDGGSIAMNNLTLGLLNQNCNVKVLAISTPKHLVNKNDIPSDYIFKTGIETVFIDTSIKIGQVLTHLLLNESYNLSRFYSKDFEDKIVSILDTNRFDIIQLESLYVAMYVDVIRKHSKAKIILRTHNIEHKLWEQKSKYEKNIFKKLYLSILAAQLKKKELLFLDKVDAVVPITSLDAEWVKNNTYQKKIFTAPFGFNIENLNLDANNKETNSLFFIGSFDWFPNVDGLNWFLKNVWNRIVLTCPDLKLYIAGKGMGEDFKGKQFKNVIIVGEVEKAQDFIQSKNIMVVPLLSGAGMRVKIIEGMAMGKVIITTSIGAEGIDATHNENIIIADTAEDFVSAIKLCVENKEKCELISKKAKAFVESNYNNTEISKRLKNFYETLI